MPTAGGGPDGPGLGRRPAGRRAGRVRGALGRAGEALACELLERDGVRILDRNWRCAAGELDVVALDRGTLVFCEVKTRRSDGFGSPFEAVTPDKQARLRRLAAAWLAGHDGPPRAVRFDVVAVRWPRDSPPSVEHRRGVCC